MATYRPIVEAKRGDFTATALVGTQAVVLAWNCQKSKLPKKLMGFAVRRSEFRPGDSSPEQRGLAERPEAIRGPG